MRPTTCDHCGRLFDDERVRAIHGRAQGHDIDPRPSIATVARVNGPYEIVVTNYVAGSIRPGHVLSARRRSGCMVVVSVGSTITVDHVAHITGLSIGDELRVESA